jgi:hypothetical protein
LTVLFFCGIIILTKAKEIKTMMKKTTTRERYNVSFSYCAGMLGSDRCFDTLEEARDFAEDYKNNFDDVDKFYSIDRLVYTTTKKLFKTTTTSRTEEVEHWFE